jgi:hypothetical protein
MNKKVEIYIPEGFNIDPYAAGLVEEGGKTVMKLYLEKVKPHRIVLEATGEKRRPKKGEHFLSFDGGINTAVFDFREDECEIYRVVEGDE